MISGLVNRGIRALEDPSKVAPFVKLHWNLAKNRNRITDWYEPEGESDYHALRITSAVFRSFVDDSEHDDRTNEWVKAKGLPRVLNRLGFSVDVYNANEVPRRSLLGGRLSVEPDDLSKYDLIIGSGDKFVEYAKQMDDDTAVIFVTGSEYWTSTVPAYLSRIDEFQRRNMDQYTDARRGFESVGFGPAISDGIVTRGDSQTKRVYQEQFPEAVVKTTPMAHPPSPEFDVSQRDYESARTNFVCYAGNGPVLKGIDIALEAFSEVKELDLYVVGPQNKERYNQFSDICDEELNHTNNIHNVGWVEMMSDDYYDVVEKCGHLIYPSCTEGGGPPGAVISMMWHGVVPIVSKAAWSDVGEYGTLLPDCEIETVRETVQHAAERSSEDLQAQCERVYDHTRSAHTRTAVLDGIESQLHALLTETGFYDSR